MNQQEFFDRTGIQTSEEDFREINQMYLEAGDNVDKDAFCEDYTKHGDSLLLNAFYKRTCDLECKIVEERAKARKMLRCLLKKADAYQDDDILATAYQIFGQAAVIKEKAFIGLLFTDSECEYIIENLK